jgi:hypothetical protein
MVEMVFALLLLQDHKIVEHRYHESLSKCLKAKRYAMKDRSSKIELYLNVYNRRQMWKYTWGRKK